MRRKNLNDLKLERDVFDTIKTNINYDLDVRINEYKSEEGLTEFMSKFKLTKDEINDKAIRDKYFEESKSIREFKDNFKRITGAVAMFKALKLEHDRLEKDSSASNELKQISKENLIYYEKKVNELGVDSELLGKCVDEPQFERFLRKHYAKEFAEKMHNIAAKNNVELAMDEDELDKDVNKQLRHETATRPMTMDKERTNVLVYLQIPTSKFFEKVYPEKEPTFSRNEPANLQYYDLVDGKYQEKEVPNGFFKGLIYRIKRYFSDERKMINDEKKTLEEYKKLNNGKELEVENYIKPQEEPTSVENQPQQQINQEVENINLANALVNDANLDKQLQEENVNEENKEFSQVEADKEQEEHSEPIAE